jgi:putrescine aminotransferase
VSNQYQTAQLRELDALHHLHPFTNHTSLRGGGARVIVRGDGSYIWDSEGNRILDGMAGLWTTNVGYGRRELADAAHAQMLELPFYNTFFRTTHPPVVALSRKLAEIAPANINQVFYGSSGSESNDTAIRLIRHYWVLKGEPKRQIIISRRSAYHGSTIAAGSMGGMSHVHAHSYPRYEGFRHVMDPYWYGEAKDGETPEAFGIRAARAIEDEILAVGPENVAAFAGEPVQGAGGVKIPPQSYWPEVQRIVDKYGVLLLADEVITGFGRLGTWFGSEFYGIRPNLITFAKAATSGYIPLSGLLIDDKIVDALMGHDDDFHHGYTFSGHPVACAVALKNLEIIEREKLVARVKEFTGPALARMLAKFKDHPLVGEVRSVGLLGAIELVADKRARRRFADPGRVGLICRDHFIREGFIMRAVFDTMVTAPPLMWAQAQFEEAEAVIGRALDLTLNDVAGEIAA